MKPWTRTAITAVPLARCHDWVMFMALSPFLVFFLVLSLVLFLDVMGLTACDP